MSQRFKEIGPNFWNLRGSFAILFGMVELGAQMSFIRLSNGNFVVLDTVGISPETKVKIDELTENGTKIDSVVATHPFHTLYFRAFHEMYPSAKYYGTPRHLRNIKDIPWTGSVTDEETKRKWEPEGIFMRIPLGAEFDNPEESNHFSGVHVFHQASRTIHVDDTIMYFENPGCILRCANKTADKMEFWDLEKGLYPTAEAPNLFKMWVEQLLLDWDFDNICAAHTGNKIGGAKEKLQQTLENSQPIFDKIVAKRAGGH
jgi:hypothetical protein